MEEFFQISGLHLNIFKWFYPYSIFEDEVKRGSSVLDCKVILMILLTVENNSLVGFKMRNVLSITTTIRIIKKRYKPITINFKSDNPMQKASF